MDTYNKLMQIMNEKVNKNVTSVGSRGKSNNDKVVKMGNY